LGSLVNLLEHTQNSHNLSNFSIF